MEIELTFENYVEKEFETLKDHFLMLSDRVFKHLNLDAHFIFEVDLVDENKIQDINKNYRNIDRVTDVISFAFEDNEVFINNELPRVLGEIFICIKRAQEQAIMYKHSFKREVSFLFVHGLLHLLGYDHQEKADEEIMFKLQDEILDPLEL